MAKDQEGFAASKEPLVPDGVVMYAWNPTVRNLKELMKEFMENYEMSINEKLRFRKAGRSLLRLKLG